MSPIVLSVFGARILTLTSPLIAAFADDLAGKSGGITHLLNQIGLVLGCGGLLFATLMFMMGKTERLLYGLAVAGIGALCLIGKGLFFTASVVP